MNMFMGEGGDKWLNKLNKDEFESLVIKNSRIICSPRREK